MNVEEFVTEVLTELKNAVLGMDDSQIKFQINSVSGIDFDIAVVTSKADKSTTDKSGGLRVQVVEGGIKKGGETSNSEQITSRIKFNIAAADMRTKPHKQGRVIRTNNSAGRKPFFTGEEIY